MAHCFVLDTSGHCFLCLSRAKTWKSEVDNGPPHGDAAEVPNIFSLQKICQYLKLNLIEVMTQAGISVRSSESVLEESELKVTLCEDCVQLNERFSLQILELEEIQMKLQSSLKSVCEKIEEDQNDEGKLVGFRKEMTRRPETIAQIGAVEQLRKATLERCSRKLTTVEIQLIVQSMPDPAVEPISDIKIEVYPDTDPLSDADHEQSELIDGVDVKFTPYSLVKCDICHLNVEDITAHHSTAHKGTKRGTSKLLKLDSKEATVLRKYRKILPAPPNANRRTNANARDNHKCHLCGKTFARIAYLNIHLNSIHLKLRKFRCDLCGKAFAQKGSFNRHRRVVHCSKALKKMKPSDVIQVDPLSDQALSSDIPEDEGDTLSDDKPTSSALHNEEKPKTSTTKPKTSAVKHKKVKSSGKSSSVSRKRSLPSDCPEKKPEDKLRCHLCGRLFGRIAYLNIHLKTIHMKIKKYRCDICGSEMSQKGSLNRHRRNHFKC